MKKTLPAGRFMVVVLASSLLAGTTSGAASVDDRGIANAALRDIRATIAEIVRIEDGFAVGHENYIAAAERARNGLVGSADSEYVASAGNITDSAGAIAHLDALLDRKSESVWTPALQGAKINLLAAAQSLSDSLHEKQMEDYETDLTTALSDLSLAIGRPSDRGVLGGIAGALAATTLGVPAGATMVPGCRIPVKPGASAYGVVNGNLTFVTLPRTSGEAAVPDNLLVHGVAVQNDRLVLYTQPQPDVSRLCGSAAAAAGLAPSVAHARRVVPTTAAAPLVRLAANTTSVVAQTQAAPTGVVSYTAAQAHAGAAVYASTCVSCHGANLQGVAGPAVAGKEFLGSAATNKWSYADVRNLVVQQMPLNNPGSLSPTQYANVIAYLLAASCFPAADKAFPEKDDPALAATKFVAPAAPVTASNTALQTCTVH